MTPRNDAITAATAALWGGHRDIANATADAKAFVKVLEALGVLKFDETPPIRAPFDPQAEGVVSAIIEKTLYEKDWPDTAVAGFIIDDLHKAGFEIVRISGKRHEHLRHHPQRRARFRA
jgi:hypothetical protein